MPLGLLMGLLTRLQPGLRPGLSLGLGAVLPVLRTSRAGALRLMASGILCPAPGRHEFQWRHLFGIGNVGGGALKS